MDAPQLFAVAPYLAVFLGLLCGFGAVRSIRVVVLLFCLALALQVFGWTALFVASQVVDQGWTESWQNALGAGFIASLLTAFSYTTIGAVIGAGIVEAARLSRQQHRGSRN